MALEIQSGAQITGQNNLSGVVETVTRDADTNTMQALVRFADGQYALVPVSLIQSQADGTYFLPIGASELAGLGSTHRRSDEDRQTQSDFLPVGGSETITLGESDVEDRSAMTSSATLQSGLSAQQSGLLSSAGQTVETLAAGETRAIPIVEEQLAVGKQEIESGRVRLVKRIEERQEVADTPLISREAKIERVAVNRVLDAPVSVRNEGDTMIIPVMEEMLVVSKQLVLKEELRVTLVTTEYHAPQTVTLRREVVEVERIAADAALPVEDIVSSALESVASGKAGAPLTTEGF